MLTLQRCIFIVRQSFLIAVGLIRGSDNDLAYPRAAAAGLQQIPCAGDIGLEGGDRIAIGNGNDRLSSQVNNRIDFVFAQGPFQDFTVADISPDNLDLIDQF